MEVTLWHERESVSFKGNPNILKVYYGILQRNNTLEEQHFLWSTQYCREVVIVELSRLLRAYGESNAMESIALTAAIMLPPLLLQKPHPKDKVKDNISCLEKRLTLWKEGNISELLHESNSIQQRLPVNSRSVKKDTIAKKFVKLMKMWKVRLQWNFLHHLKHPPC